MTATVTAKQVEWIKDLCKQAGYRSPGQAAKKHGMDAKGNIARGLSKHEASRLIDALQAEIRTGNNPLDEIDDDVLIAELESRGYTVS